MTDDEKIVSRIRAIMSASEETVAKLNKYRNDREDILLAKEVAYDHIKGVLEDVGFNPWQE